MRASLLSVSLLALLCSTTASAIVYEQPGLRPLLSETARVTFSRDRNAPTACDVAILVSGQQGAELALGESISFDVPAGESTVQMMLSPAGYCGALDLRNSQSILINAGETRQFEIRVTPDSIFIAPESE